MTNPETAADYRSPGTLENGAKASSEHGDQGRGLPASGRSNTVYLLGLSDRASSAKFVALTLVQDVKELAES